MMEYGFAEPFGLMLRILQVYIYLRLLLNVILNLLDNYNALNSEMYVVHGLQFFCCWASIGLVKVAR